MLAFAVILLFSIALYVLIAVWAERKVAAFIQDRLGPMETGKWGLLQTLADILKMVQKEHIVPSLADKLLFAIAPVMVFVSVYLGFAALPFSGLPFVSNLAIFYLIAIISIELLGVLMAGWASNNKYALYGSMRAVAQAISYEIPAGLAVLSAIMLAGSLDIATISVEQGIGATTSPRFWGFWDVSAIGGIFSWNIFQAPHVLIAFVVYFICGLAESNRAPFDIPEAESEIVAGFHVEYSGFRFALFMLAEYAMMLLVSVLAVILFLGAMHSPLPNIGSLMLNTWTEGPIWGAVWLFGKALILVMLQIWIRWTYPRLRVDQLMAFCWKVLLPVSLACVVLSGVWKLVILT